MGTGANVVKTMYLGIANIMSSRFGGSRVFEESDDSDEDVYTLADLVNDQQESKNLEEDEESEEESENDEDESAKVSVEKAKSSSKDIKKTKESKSKAKINAESKKDVV